MRHCARWEVAGVTGTVVVVDVLRAFTTAAYAFDAGAAEIWLAGSVEEALALGRELDALVMGETGGRRPDGFDLSNSPVAAAQADLAGRTLVQRTGAGVQGALAAVDADVLLASSLVVASATARAIGDEEPTYLITGRFEDGSSDGEDDRFTAELIERARLGRPLDVAATAAAVATSREADITRAVGAGHFHPDDIAYATDVDRFAFAMPIERVDSRLRITKRPT